MKNKCSINNLIKYSEERLSNNKKEKVKNHIEGCKECQNMYQSIRSAEKFLTFEVDCESNIKESVLSKIYKEKYTTKKNPIKGFYYKNYYNLKVAVSLVILIGISSLIFAFIKPITTSIYSTFDEIKEIIVDHKKEIKDNIPVLERDRASQMIFNTYVNKDAYGMLGPGLNYDKIAKLDYGQVILITGKLENGKDTWFLGKKVSNFSLDKLIEVDENQEFWIHSDNINLQTQNAISFDSTFTPSLVCDYSYIVLNKGRKQITLKQLPKESSNSTCAINADNLIAVIQKDREWSFVLKFNASSMASSAEMGWIKNSEYMWYTPALSSVRPNQGFLVKPFDILKEDGSISDMPDYLIQNPITPVNIIGYNGKLVHLSSGFNGLEFYVDQEALRLQVLPENVDNILNNEIDKDSLKEKIKSIISKAQKIDLYALDENDKSVSLSNEQKNKLANSLTNIYEVTKFDGGILPLREAVYPFYSLKIEGSNDIQSNNMYKDKEKYEQANSQSSITVTGDSSLLLNIEGLQPKSAVPIRFIKTNKEFVDYIKALRNVPPNNDVSNLNYLLNARKVIVTQYGSVNGNTYEGKEQQVNKCVRTILKYIDTYSVKTKPEKSPDVGNFQFVFEDGTKKTVLVTEKYFQIEDTYYNFNNNLKDRKGPINIFIELFAAYF